MLYTAVVTQGNGRVNADVPSERSINDQIAEQLNDLLSIHLQFGQSSYRYLQDSSAPIKLMQTVIA